MAVRAAAQDHGIAGLQAQHAGIRGDVGTALEDHADDAERHAHALDGHAVGPLPAFSDGADGIGNRAYGRDTAGHGIDARWRQRQAVEEGGGRTAGTDLGDVLGIGRENLFCVGADRPLDRLQRAVLLLRRRQRQHPRGGARPVAEVCHQSGQIGVAVDCLERRGHRRSRGLEQGHVLARKSRFCEVRNRHGWLAISEAGSSASGLLGRDGAARAHH